MNVPNLLLSPICYCGYSLLVRFSFCSQRDRSILYLCSPLHLLGCNWFCVLFFLNLVWYMIDGWVNAYLILRKSFPHMHCLLSEKWLLLYYSLQNCITLFGSIEFSEWWRSLSFWCIIWLSYHWSTLYYVVHSWWSFIHTEIDLLSYRWHDPAISFSVIAWMQFDFCFVMIIRLWNWVMIST